jgi:uncharacterized protein (TIGR02118 family)
MPASFPASTLNQNLSDSRIPRFKKIESRSNRPGGRFDMAYYLDRHMPMSIARLSPAKGFRSVSVERGLGGGFPGAPPAYIAMCQYAFDTTEDFLAAFGPHAGELQGDMPKYTDIEPVIQFSEIALSA